ncbi:MAG: TMEM175 family protein [Actinomycetota bacterium]
MLDGVSEDQPESHRDDSADPWTQRFYDRGTQGFERVILFSDAVYAIALTLIAATLVAPTLTSATTTQDAGAAIADGVSNIAVYAFTFLWIAFYWKANHRFTLTLRRMDNLYIWAMLAYLAFVALLPFPASILGESGDPRALAFFMGYMACISFLEVVLMLIAIRNDLLVRTLTTVERRNWVFSALSPVMAAVIAIPVCFIPGIGFAAGVTVLVVVSIGIGFAVKRIYRVPNWSYTRH